MLLLAATSTSSSTTLVGIIAGAASGLIVGLLTAGVGAWNTTRLLGAEDKKLDAQREQAAQAAQADLDRLESQLTFQREEAALDRASERDRLERSLSHERELADLAEVRSMCDELLEVAEKIKNDYTKFELLQRYRDVDDNEVETFYSETTDLVLQLSSLENRFRVRSLDGISSPTIDYMHSVQVGCRSMRDAHESGVQVPEDNEERALLLKALFELTNAIRDCVRSRLPAIEP